MTRNFAAGRGKRGIIAATSMVWAVMSISAASAQQQPYPQQQQQPYPQQQQQQPYPQQQQPYPQQQYPQNYPQQYPQQQQPYPAPAPYPTQAPPPIPPQQLDQLVAPIALYPDPLLAQVLTASTYSNEIPDAATWATQHSYLRGPDLANAIQQDNLPWDASVLALIPFPSVLDYMARNMYWTQQLGNAVLDQRGDVMDSVQRMRQQAMSYGYLQTNPYTRVVTGPAGIEVVPVNPDLYYVPYYDPRVVFVRPRPGFLVSGAIRFGPAITIGAFLPFGWHSSGFGWRDHTIIIDRRPWVRTWSNRGTYVHPYVVPRPVHPVGPRIEHHEIHRGPGPERGRDHDHDHR